MNKFKKIGMICISGFAVLVAGVGIAATIVLPHMAPVRISDGSPFIWNNDTLAGDAVLSADQVREDVQTLTKLVDETHPIFLDGVPEQYQRAKDELLLSANQAMLLDDLRVLINQYMTSLQDGHTRVYWSEHDWLELCWRCKDTQLFVLDAQGFPTKKTVIAIGGIPVETLMETADKLFPAENLPAKELNYDEYLRSKRFLKLLGINTRDKVDVEVLENGSVQHIDVGFSSKTELNNKTRGVKGKAINKDTYLVTMGTCEVNDALSTTIKGVKAAIADGTKRVIIDIRDNQGGNSNACKMLLEAIGMEPGSFGATIRYSPLAKKEYGYLQSTGYYVYKASNEVVKNPNIALYVITNKDTFSSAQWMATWVKDGKLGTIVGQPSSNKPSSYGDVLYFQLPNSKMIGGISYKKWLRPDQSKNDEPMLEPDILVETGKDPVEVILGM